MKNKLIGLTILFIIIPLTGIAFNVEGVEDTQLQLSEHLQKIVENIPSKNQLIENGKMMLETRWKEPLKAEYIVKELRKYEDKALISFTSFNQRAIFIEHLEDTNIEIVKIYSSIPAISISYKPFMLEEVDFRDFKIKYLYNLGSIKFFVPQQNVGDDRNGLIQLSELIDALNVDEVHEEGITGYGVNVAVLDSGINYTNIPGLEKLRNYDEDKIIADFTPAPEIGEDNKDYSGHGTHMAAILGANGKYIRAGREVDTEDYGIAPDVKMYNVKVLDKTGFGEDEWLLSGFDLILDPDSPINTDIISASLTSITYAAIGDPIEELVYLAGSRGILVVASAGNYGPTGSSVGAPALWDNAISVGATENMKDLAIFTSKGLNQNYSLGVDILAPGRNIQSIDALTGGSYYTSGTSASVPIITGVLALLIQAFPGLDIHKYESALFQTATDINQPVIAQGAGIVNAEAAYQYLAENSDKDIFSVLPRRISPKNLHYYSSVEGSREIFTAKLISSADQTLNLTVTGDASFVEIPSSIDVYNGWNHFNFNLTIPWNTGIKNINAQIRINNLEQVINVVDINIQTRFYGGRVLFDIAHDFDKTENKWFDSSTPIGMHQVLARNLKDRGFQVLVHDTFNSSYQDTDILIISDPELEFTSFELNQIENFVTNGGSLLFLINGMRLIDSGEIDDEPLIASNFTVCEQILTLFDMANVGSGNVADTPYIATTTEQATMINTDSFIFWGWPIIFNETNSWEGGSNNNVLAEIELSSGAKLPVALSTDFEEGRVMVFGSGYPFTDLGLAPDTFETNPRRADLPSNAYKVIFELDENNKQLVNDTFNWLISKRRPIFNVEISTQPLIRQSFTVGVSITQYNGAPYFNTSGNEIYGTMVFQNKSYSEVILSMNSATQKYEVELILDQFGYHTLYIPLNITTPLHTPTDGRIDIFCNVPLWNELPLIKNVVLGLIIFIFASIALIPIVRNRFRKIQT